MFKFRALMFALFSIIILFSFTGCEKKNETVPEKNQDVTEAETTKVQEPEEPETVIPDVKGTWSGKLYNRVATLNVTEQDSVSFKGNLTVFFRENINQTVTGKIDPSTLKVTMKDQVHNRAMGTYSGKISEDSKTLSGTFTMNSDKSTHSFNFSKK